jgi:hypothetical protein
MINRKQFCCMLSDSQPYFFSSLVMQYIEWQTENNLYRFKTNISMPVFVYIVYFTPSTSKFDCSLSDNTRETKYEEN